MDRLFAIHRAWYDTERLPDPPIVKRLFNYWGKRSLDSWCFVDDDTDSFFEKDGMRVIPIGGIPFVSKWLKTAGAVDPEMTPLEIPEILQSFLLGRPYFHCSGKEVVEKYMDGHTWFVKNASHLKTWNSICYDDMDWSYYIDNDDDYIVTEKCCFASEYRVFVHDDEIQGCMCYLGRPTVFPNGETLQEMVKEYGKVLHPRSYTLDVGVLMFDEKEPWGPTYGATVPIEVHPFVACGLYGFHDPVLLDMYEGGWNWYLRDARQGEQNEDK